MGTHLSVIHMGFQATYRVYGLDFENTYNCLEVEAKTNKDVEKLSDIVKGTFDFWLAVNGEHILVQLSNKGAVNVWHEDEACIQKAVKKLKKLVVDNEGKECGRWILKNQQTMGSEKLVTAPSKVPLEQVIKTIENLRYRLLREPTIREVARKIGETPEETYKLVWKLIPKTGWREPSKKQISLAEMKLHEIYEIAALLERFDEESVRKRALGIPGSWTKDDGGKIINPGILHMWNEPWDESIDKIFERAKYALKHERDKLPRITFVKENEQQIEFDYHWPKPTEEWENQWGHSSEIQWGDSSEIYDKTTKSFSGAFTGERQIIIGEEPEPLEPTENI